MRSTLFGFCLGGAVILAAAGCGAPEPLCSTSNCGGCCRDDACYQNTAQYCGRNAQACIECGASEECDHAKETCVPKCRPDNCDGCCESGTCHTTNTAKCGGGGKACFSCPSGESCDLDTRTCQPKCRPGTCAGCCEGTTCRSGTTALYCGGGGQACGTCPSEASCATKSCVCPAGSCLGNDNQCWSCTEGSCSRNPSPILACAAPQYGVSCCKAGTCRKLAESCGDASWCCGGLLCAGGGTTYTCQQLCTANAQCSTGCCVKLNNSDLKICQPAGSCP